MKFNKLDDVSADTNKVKVMLSGEFDAQGCKLIRQDLEQIAEQHPKQHIELDLEEVTFIDSSGIGAIVFLYKRLLEMNSTLLLTQVAGQPKELITLLRVDKAIKVEFAESGATQ